MKNCPHLTREEWKQLRNLAFRAQQEVFSTDRGIENPHYYLYGLFDTVREYSIRRMNNVRDCT